MYNPLNILYSDLPTDLSLHAAYLRWRPLSRVIMVLISCRLNPVGELLLSIFLQGIVLLVKMLVGIPPPLRRVSMTVGPVQQMDRGGTRQARAASPPPTPCPPQTHSLQKKSMSLIWEWWGRKLIQEMLRCCSFSDYQVSSRWSHENIKHLLRQMNFSEIIRLHIRYITYWLWMLAVISFWYKT